MRGAKSARGTGRHARRRRDTSENVEPQPRVRNRSRSGRSSTRSARASSFNTGGRGKQDVLLNRVEGVKSRRWRAGGVEVPGDECRAPRGTLYEKASSWPGCETATRPSSRRAPERWRRRRPRPWPAARPRPERRRAPRSARELVRHGVEVPGGECRAPSGIGAGTGASGAGEKSVGGAHGRRAVAHREAAPSSAAPGNRQRRSRVKETIKFEHHTE